MKAKNIINKLIAPFVLLTALFSGCAQDELVPGLDGLKVEPSYLSIAKEGSSVDVIITAKENWTITAVPEWLNVSATSGEANPDGVKVTFSALKAYENLNAEVIVSAGPVSKIVKVEQLIGDPAPTSTKDFVENGVDGKLYVLQGIAGVIENTVYGNFYMNDGTYDGPGAYIYGMLDANGAEKNFLSLGIEEGDEIVVSGIRKTYSGKKEIEKAQLVRIVKKSLLGLKTKNYQVSKDAGSLEAAVNVKGETISVTVPEEFDWIHFDAIKGSGANTEIIVSYSENTTPDPREGKFNIKSTKAGKDGKVEESVAEVVVCQLPAEPAVKTVSEIDFNGNEYVHVTGTIAALTKNGFILDDDSKNEDNKVYVEVPDFIYRAHKPGYKVKVLGVASTKYANRKVSSNIFEVTDKTATEYTHAESVVIDKDNVAGVMGQKTADVKYYSFSGFVNGKSRIMLVGATQLIEAESAIDDINLKGMNGKFVTGEGYYIDNNTKDATLKFVFTSLKAGENAPEYFKLPEGSKKIDWNSLSESFDVVANVEWTASLPEGLKGVSISPAQGKGSAKVTVTFDGRNDTYKDEDVKVTISYKIGDEDKTSDFSLKRLSKTLKLGAAESLIAPGAQQYTITVTASRFWKVVSLPEGMTADKMEGMGTDAIVLSVPAATTNDRKEYEVKVAEDRVEEPAQEASFKFTQRAANEVESHYVKVDEAVAGTGYLLYHSKGVFTLPDKAYGYGAVTEVPLADGDIKTFDTLDEFELIAADGGFKIKFAKKGYMYMDGTYNSFNFSDVEPASAGVWTFEIQDNGTVKVLNLEKQKYIQLDSKYGTFGSYDSEKGDLPVLFKKK